MQRSAKYRCFASGAVLFLLLFIVSLVYGHHIQSSYVHDTCFQDLLKDENLRVLYYHYPFDKQYDIYGEGQSVNDLQDIEHGADLIVKVRMESSSKREIYQECVLSQAQVIKQYKGDALLKTAISIFEPVNCTGIKGMLLCSEGYSPMQEGTEYILFLKQLKNSLFGEDAYVYLPSTLTFSKYAVDEHRAQALPKKEMETEGMLYSEIRNEEVFLYEQTAVEWFAEVKEQVLNRYY